MASLSLLSFEIFKPFKNLICLFSTRRNGFSKEPYDSLNLGLRTGDNFADIEKNRAKFFKEISIHQDQIAFTDQIHSARAIVIEQSGIYSKSDALITARKGLFLAIQAADCFPIFLYDPKNQIIAAIHAGWRGVVDGIIENTISSLCTVFSTDSSDLFAAVGPGLQRECFEVREDVYNLVDRKYMTQHPDRTKKFFDLQSLIEDRLINIGIIKEHVDLIPLCTKCENNLFFSYRRDKAQSGRMMGIIGLL